MRRVFLRERRWVGLLAAAAMAVAAAVSAPAPAADAPAEADPAAAKADEAFERLYGQDMERVRGTAEPEDDVALAKRLLAAAREATGTPALLRVLCEKAHHLAAGHPDGYATAVEAAELLASQIPAEAAACAERVAEVRQKQYARARDEAKTAAGERLIGALLALAEAHVEATAYPQAIAALTKAMGVARSADSDRLALVEARRERARFLLRTRRDIENMKALIERDPENAAAREKLVRLYLVRLDDPAAAAEHLDGVEDEDLLKYVPAAARGVPAAPELACIELGDWYRGLGETAPTPAKRAMFERAKAYYDRFLSLHETEDLDRTTATLALKKVEAALEKLAPAAAERPATAAGETGAGAAGETAKAPEGGVIKPGTWVDLLPLVDLKEDAVKGKWVRKGKALIITDPVRNGRITVPVVPDGDYRLHAEFVRVAGDADVYVQLPVGPSAVGVALGAGMGRKRDLLIRVYKGGVVSRSSDEPHVADSTAVRTGQRHALDISVRCEDDDTATVLVRLDGKPHLSWRGDPEKLKVDWDWHLKNNDTFGLGAYGSQVVYQTLRLKMLDGTAKYLRAQQESESGTSGRGETVEAPEGEVIKPGKWVDLLPLVDLPQHAVKGEWVRQGGRIVLKKEAGGARLMLPAVPLGSYELEVVGHRRWGDSTLAIILPVADTGVAVSLDYDHGSAAGLDQVNGKAPDKNETRLKPIHVGKRDHTMHVTVKVAGPGAGIRVTVDGQPHIDWKGPLSALSLPKKWALPVRRAIGLGGWFSRVQFRKVRLKMLSGEARVLRPPEKEADDGVAGGAETAGAAAAKGRTIHPGESVDLLAAVDPAKDAVKGTWQKTQVGLTVDGAKEDWPTWRMTLPVVPRGDYTLEVTFERLKAGKGSADFFLPVGEERVLLTVDGFHGGKSALHLIDGKMGGKTGTLVEHPPLATGKAHRLVVRVDREGSQAKIASTLNGRPLVTWTGPAAALSLGEGWQLPHPGTMGLLCQAPMLFKEVRLRMRSGEARLLRPLALPTALADLPRDDEGFYRLVPDDDLGAWQNAEGGAPPAGWEASNGNLRLEDPAGKTLWTRRQFDDFILDLQFLGQGNSGIFFRTADPTNPVRTGLEVQIIPPRKDRKPSKRSCGALYGLVAPVADVTRVGAWNRMVLTVAGPNVRVELNGKPILATKLPPRLEAADGPGYIGLQDHGDKVQFRNIRLKPLER